MYPAIVRRLLVFDTAHARFVVVSAGLCHRLSLAKWWVPVQIILPPAPLIATTWQVLPWIFLLVFVALLLVYWNTARNQMPFCLTTRITWAALAELLPEEKGGQFIDIGCGIGGALLYSRASAPPFELAWLRRFRTSTRNLKLIYGDF